MHRRGGRACSPYFAYTNLLLVITLWLAFCVTLWVGHTARNLKLAEGRPQRFVRLEIAFGI